MPIHKAVQKHQLVPMLAGGQCSGACIAPAAACCCCCRRCLLLQLLLPCCCPLHHHAHCEEGKLGAAGQVVRLQHFTAGRQGRQGGTEPQQEK